MGMRKRVQGSPKLAIAYVRVSTEGQKLGPEAQRAAIEEWARREGIGIVQWCIDQGVGGATELEERPGLVEALVALREHRAGVLVVAKRDRLARDAAVAALIDRSVRREGAVILSADGVGNGEDPGQQFLRTVIDGAAAYERALIRQRTKAAAAAKKARGQRVGTVPYGYRVAEKGVQNEQGRMQTLEPDPGEQAVMARIWGMRERSLRAIVAALQAEGIVGRTGRPLQVTQVRRLMKREPLSTCDGGYLPSPKSACEEPKRESSS